MVSQVKHFLHVTAAFRILLQIAAARNRLRVGHDRRIMSSYVPVLSTYNLCQNLHAGRLDLQARAAQILREINPRSILDVGPSDGLFSTDFLVRNVSGAQIYTTDIDENATEQLRRNFALCRNVFPLDHIDIKHLAKKPPNEIRNKIDVVYLGGTWTDTGTTKPKRIPVLVDLVNNVLRANGTAIFDEELIPDYSVSGLWRHHGDVILNGLLNSCKHERLAGGIKIDKFEFPTQDEFRNLLRRKTNGNLSQYEHAVFANIYFQQAIEELRAFASGLGFGGDHKSTLIDFKDELSQAGFRNVDAERIWPINEDLIALQDSDEVARLGELRDFSPLRERVWDECSARVIDKTLQISSTNRENMDNDRSFQEACALLRDFQLFLSQYDPSQYEHLGLKLIPAGEVDFGVHMFVARK